jgi:hypothetical protein
MTSSWQVTANESLPLPSSDRPLGRVRADLGDLAVNNRREFVDRDQIVAFGEGSRHRCAELLAV